MLRGVLIALLFAVGFGSASAQSARVVQTCGVLSPSYAVGSSQPPTVDINGNACGTASVTSTTDPCQTGGKTYTSDASQTSSTRYVVGSNNKKTYVCQVFIFASAAESVSVVEGTGSTCGTNTKALYGNATVSNGLLFAASGGFSVGNGSATVQSSPSTGTDICVLQAGSSRVSVSLVTVQQ